MDFRLDADETDLSVTLGMKVPRWSQSADELMYLYSLLYSVSINSLQNYNKRLKSPNQKAEISDFFFKTDFKNMLKGKILGIFCWICLFF